MQRPSAENAPTEEELDPLLDQSSPHYATGKRNLVLLLLISARL